MFWGLLKVTPHDAKKKMKDFNVRCWKDYVENVFQARK